MESLKPITTVIDGKHIIYECGICSCYHPWDFNGDCRNDPNRYNSPEEYAEKHGLKGELIDLEVRDMDDRIEADLNPPSTGA